MSVHVLPMVDPELSGRCPGFITALIVRVAQGDEAALDRLFDLALPMVLTILRRNATAPADTDGQVVEAFARIWRQAPTYDPSSRRVVAWLTDQVTAEAEFPDPVARAVLAG